MLNKQCETFRKKKITKKDRIGNKTIGEDSKIGSLVEERERERERERRKLKLTGHLIGTGKKRKRKYSKLSLREKKTRMGTIYRINYKR